MKMQVFILIAIIFLGLLIGLGGCVYHPNPSPLFYQAHDPSHLDAPAPFFLTIEEAQSWANQMNQESKRNYQVSFIAR